jgi:hypothetical protein
LLSKKHDNRIGDRLGLLEEDHMTSLGNVHHVDAGSESFMEGMPVLRRGDAVFQTLHDENRHVLGRLHPVILRRRAVGGSLGGGRGRPPFHLTKDCMGRCRIGDESFGRFETLGLARVLTKPRLQRPDDLWIGSHEADSSQQDDATDEIRTIRRQASCHSIAEAVTNDVRRSGTTRFDDCGDVTGQSMQRQALQFASASVNPAWVDRHGMEAGARDAPGEVVEIRRVKPTPWNEHNGIACSIGQEFDPGAADFNLALQGHESLLTAS